jgi:hypothetical protein
MLAINSHMGLITEWNNSRSIGYWTSEDFALIL